MENSKTHITYPGSSLDLSKYHIVPIKQNLVYGLILTPIIRNLQSPQNIYSNSFYEFSTSESDCTNINFMQFPLAQPKNAQKIIAETLKSTTNKIHHNWLITQINNLGVKIPNEEEVKLFIQKDPNIENVLIDVLKTAIEKSGNDRELLLSVYPDTVTDLYICIRQANYQDSTLINQLYHLIDELRIYTSKKEVEADLDISILIDTDYVAPERIHNEQSANSTV